MGELQIGTLIIAADVVHLTGDAALQDGEDGLAVVINVDPVANIEAVSVERDLLAFEQIAHE